MRVAIVFFAPKNRDKMIHISKALAKGIESKGHQVEVIDGDHDVNTKLTIFQYIIIGTTATTAFGGKIPDKVSTFLANSGMVSGKRSTAFLLKGGLRAGKTLRVLMKVMEKEGMYLKFSEILSSEPEAEEIGKRLHIST